MVEFNLWKEAFIFASIYSVIILVPCVLIALMGRKMIDQLAYHPSNAPEILMSICLKFIVLAVLSLWSLISFYFFFVG